MPSGDQNCGYGTDTNTVSGALVTGYIMNWHRLTDRDACALFIGSDQPNFSEAT